MTALLQCLTRLRYFVSGLVLTGVVASMPVAADAQEKSLLPDTPAGRRAAAVLRLMDRVDAASVRVFVQENMDPGYQRMPLDVHSRSLERMSETLDGARVVGVDSRAPVVIDVLFATEQGPQRLHVETEPVEPFRISGIQLSAAQPPIRFQSSSRWLG